MKIPRIAIVSVIILILLGIAGWKLRTFFLQNHVVFLLNQHRLGDARSLSNTLFEADPGDLTNRYHRIRIAALNGDYRQVSAVEREPTELNARIPETLYWRALAEYRLGHESLSRALAQDFLNKHGHMPDAASVKIARALAGATVDLVDNPEKSEPSFNLIFDVEKGIYLALAGEKQMDAGFYSEATRLYNEAFAYRLRSQSIMAKAARAAAMAGMYQKADLFLAYAGPDTAEQLYKYFRGEYEKNSTAVPMINPGSGREGKLRLAQCSAWAAGKYAQGNLTERQAEVLSYLGGLQQTYPYDIILPLRLAEFMVMTNMIPEATALYQSINDEAGNIQTALRKWSLADLPEAEIVSRFKQLMDQVSTDYRLDMVSTSSEATAYHTVQENATSGAFTIERRGRYMISTVARAEAQDYEWPVLTVKIAKITPEFYYVNHNTWDCYSAFVLLDKGRYTYEITASTKSEKPGNNPARIELMSFFVTDAGVE